MSNAFWEDLKVDWANPEFRAKFCNQIWKMGFDEGLRIGRMKPPPMSYILEEQGDYCELCQDFH